MEHTTELRVRYAETDAMGIVHHASYLVWMEAGRTELFRHGGQAYTAWEARGVSLSVAEVQVTYRAPARFDDRVEVRTRLLEAGRRRVAFGYEIAREGVRLAEGRTVHLVTGVDGRGSVLPEDLLRLLQGWISQDHGPR